MENLAGKQCYLICPVSEVSDYFSNATSLFVEKLETAGAVVHYPPRDTPQEDISVAIATNIDAIKKAEYIFVTWDGVSLGSVFDLGVASALGKQIIAVTPLFPTEVLMEHRLVLYVLGLQHENLSELVIFSEADRQSQTASSQIAKGELKWRESKQTS